MQMLVVTGFCALALSSLSSAAVFDLLHTTRTSPNSPIPDLHLYRSSETGLTVAICPIPGPLVYGFFSLATEPHHDNGCPHALNHLCPSGSEDYPYNGVLDELAHRSLGDGGAGGWTGVDHTAHTLRTAGQDGFLSLLPIYLDHILFPTLTDSAFLTKIHHVNGAGADGGVHYSLVQATENDDLSRVRLAIRRLCFPNHGYSAEHAGTLHGLRHLTIDTVRRYHADYYRPENLTLIIAGVVDLDRLFTALQPIQEKILRKRSSSATPPFIKPWQSPPPPIQTTEQTVYFPTNDESIGMVEMAWPGPIWADLTGKMQLKILWLYLSESAASPLHQALVECDPPLCSRIWHKVWQQSSPFSTVTFFDAASATMDQILPKTMQTLQEVVQNAGQFNLIRLHHLIEKQRHQTYSFLEAHPHVFVAYRTIDVTLYGSLADLDQVLEEDRILTDLLNLDASDWIDFLRRMVVEAPRVTVFGRPSIALDEEFKRGESERISAQIARLGPDGLAACAQSLQNAEQANSVRAPAALIESFPIPDVNNIPMIAVNSATNLSRSVRNRLESVSVDSLPFSIQIDSIPTPFVELCAICDTEVLSPDLRLYLNLYAELLFESNVRLHPTRQEMLHDKVIAELEASVVSRSAHIGSQSKSSIFHPESFSQLFLISLKMPGERYAECANWMRTFLTGVVFTEDRVRTVCKRLYNSNAAMKRDGDSVLEAAMHISVYDPDCNHVLLSPFRQESFLSSLLERTDLTDVIIDLQRIQQELARAPAFQVVLDADRHDDVTGPLLAAFQDAKFGVAPGSFPFVSRYTNLSGTVPANLLVTVGGLDTSLLSRAARLVPTDWEDPAVPSVGLLLEYLNRKEGPLWKRIRGGGLSWAYKILADFESGLVTFNIDPTSNPVSAYAEARAVVQELLEGGPDAFLPSWIEASRTSLSCSLILSCEARVSAACQHLHNTLRGVGDDYQQTLLKQIQSVSVESMHQALAKYVAPLFSSPSSRLVVVTGTAQADNIRHGFRDQFGIDLHLTTADDLLGVLTTKKENADRLATAMDSSLTEENDKKIENE